MRRRKKTIIALVMTLAGIAALVFWPGDHPAARQAFAAVRGMVDVLPESDSVASPQAAIDPEAQVEISMVIGYVNVTDARMRLFAESVPSEKVVVGRVVSPESLLQVLQPLDVTNFNCQPRLVTLSGHRTELATIAEMAGARLIFRTVGARVGVKTDVTRADTVKLKIDCEIFYITGQKTVATSQGPAEQPLAEAIRASGQAELKAGEALFIGGLAHKATGRVAVKAPYLSDLPGIGSWFSFTREREYDEELVVLATPRIIRR